jgi:peptidoglycan/xylan/chitin deacetylase (PgdA/CDA1 family)
LINKFFSFILDVFQRLNPNGAKVFMFHDILDDRFAVKSELELSCSSFTKFIQIQLENGYHPNSFMELRNHLVNKKKIEKHSFIITFDDAFESVYTIAHPILTSHKIPFIVFVTIELIGKPNYLSEEQIVALSKDSLCTIGSHGCNHVFYRNLLLHQVKEELNKSKQVLEEITNLPVRVLSFPYGYLVACSVDNIMQAKKSGYLFSFSSITGSLKQSWITSKYFLPRINVDEEFVKNLVKSFDLNKL